MSSPCNGTSSRPCSAPASRAIRTTAATTCCCSAATPARTAGDCGRTRSRWRASTRTPARPSCSASHATWPTCRSPPAAHRTDGYDCDACYINSLSTGGVDHPSQFHGYDDPGLEATIEGVEGVTGLSINYWAMVNLAGFDALVDALGGVTVDVPKPIPIGGIGGAITG